MLRKIPGLSQSYKGLFGVTPAWAVSGFTGVFPIVDLARPIEVKQPLAFGNREDFVLKLTDGGQPLKDAPLHWRDSVPERVVYEHERPYTIRSVEVVCVRDAFLHGSGWMSRDGQVLYCESTDPDYSKVWYEKKRIYNAVDVELGSLKSRRFREAWHVVHFNCGTYGHWLCEVMPKLLVIQACRRRWPEFRDVPIIMPAVFPSFVVEHARALLPDIPIVTFDPHSEYVRVARVLMPSAGADYVYHPWIGEQLDSLSVPSEEPPARRIFVSRRTPSGFRVLDNLGELEQIAIDAGLTVVYPEEHSFLEQIAIFRNASFIAGEFGSAIHNAIFSPAGTFVFALNWINWVQSRLARFRGHRLGYLMPTNGKELLYTLEGDVQHYRIDADDFRAGLQEALQIT